MKKTLSILLLMFLTTSYTIAGNIWVSTVGNDEAAGTMAAPLKTLRQALLQAREWRRLSDKRTIRGINIILKGGYYIDNQPIFIRPEDNGTVESPTNICSADGENAIISGGIKVKGWQQQGKLWVARAPFSGNHRLQIRQLWVNDHKATRSSLFGEYKMERMLLFDTKNQTITIPTPKEIISTDDAPQLEMMIHQRWATAILRVKSMKTEDSTTIVSFCEPESRLEFTHPWPQPVINGEKGSSSYCLMNALQFVDQPGEWYQDAATGTIYYYPDARDKIDETEIIIPQRERLITIMGSAAERVSNITFNNITFEYTAWNRPSELGHVTLQGGFPIIDAYKLQTEGLPWNKKLENQAWIERPQSAVSVSWASNVNFIGCTFCHLAATALDYTIGIHDVNVKYNKFSDIGGTAILAGQFAEGATEVHRPFRISQNGDEYCERINITGNNIHDATNEDWGCVGIGAGFVRDILIDNNDVSHINYSGICVGWGWTTDNCGMRNNKITNNHVHDFARQLYDAGGIYTLSNQPCSEIAYNKIDSLGAAPYATNDRGFYIYLDEATDGYTIHDNWCPEDKFGENKPGPNVKWNK